MKKQIVLLILFLTSFLNAQECKYSEYYPIVESALKEYKAKKYKKAEEKFVLAFTKTDFPHGKHLHTALRVAQKRNNSNLAKKISIDLAKRGAPLRYFSKMKQFSWYDQFKKDFSNYSEYYSVHFNSDLREKMKRLLALDKTFNSNYHKWRNGEIELTLEELIEGATTIIEEFKTIIDKHGFPSEQKMGYYYMKRKNIIVPYEISTLLIHTYQRGVLLHYDTIEAIVCEGALHPKIGETLKTIRGHGNSTGIEQEMKIRFSKFNKKQ
jgi:hypothetical protein